MTMVDFCGGYDEGVYIITEMNLYIDLYGCLDLNEDPRSREEQLRLLLSAVLATHFDKRLAELQFE